MDGDMDLYALLGVLPGADPVVIAAAYRALVSKYHPDRWTGDAAQAHVRMTELNRAYEILRDPERRANYDAARAKRGASSASFEEQEREESTFADAARELEERWGIAVSVMPELARFRQRLDKTSHQLAFAFITLLLETRRYPQGREIADQIERQFLERYFGTNETIIQYARTLIGLGARPAVKRLNQLVDVMGSDIDPRLIMAKVDTEFNLPELRKTAMRAAEEAAMSERQLQRIKQLRSTLLEQRYFDDAIQLARELGYTVQEFDGGIFSPSKIKVAKVDEMAQRVFPNPSEFVRWAVSALL